MNCRPLFQLSPRLAACAKLVPPGARLADIGTDHAYLPVWLAKSGKITSAIACDVKEGPLQRARENIQKYQVSSLVTARLSDGLQAVSPDEVDTVVIAGMGGDLMIHILEEAPWLKSGKTIILQCMTSAEELRRWLLAEGYVTESEHAVRSEGRVYTVMRIRWSESPPDVGPLFIYIGLLAGQHSEEALTYIRREIRHLTNRIQGSRAREARSEAQALEDIVEQLSHLVTHIENSKEINE